MPFSILLFTFVCLLHFILYFFSLSLTLCVLFKSLLNALRMMFTELKCMDEQMHGAISMSSLTDTHHTKHMCGARVCVCCV